MLDHLVEQIGKHGLFDLRVEASGDLHVDEHHTVEDVGIALGQAFDQALGDRRGIVRMADALVPLDEALASVAIDISGRPFCSVEAHWTLDRIGELPSSLVEHLLGAFAAEAKLTLHARVLQGENDHHRAEAMCKALGRALCAATRIDPRRGGEVPSTKGTLG
jgi:imidazoleglycerol-phosphate dehydratase